MESQDFLPSSDFGYGKPPKALWVFTRVTALAVVFSITTLINVGIFMGMSKIRVPTLDPNIVSSTIDKTFGDGSSDWNELEPNP